MGKSGDQPISYIKELEVPVKDLTIADCPPSAREFYENVPIIYTWVDGSDPDYAKTRERYGGKAAVGGARDRDSGELRFSLRSLLKFLPWWKGEIFIVAPNQTPLWLKTAHPRVHIVVSMQPTMRRTQPTFLALFWTEFRRRRTRTICTRRTTASSSQRTTRTPWSSGSATRQGCRRKRRFSFI